MPGAQHTVPAGIEKFKGRYLHSRDYKDAQAFTDKRVVVIGIGNSGSDLAVEISQTAQQVFLSTRRGAWILNRVGDQGYPIDTILTTRLNTFLQKLLSSSMACDHMEKKLNARFDHSRYGLKPKHRVFQQHPTVNDDLPNRIISGRVRALQPQACGRQARSSTAPHALTVLFSIAMIAATLLYVSLSP
ncbi:hypothetical protein TURU_050468 [Turdus rufiventris]|nr:hypothetical protein TURU_050468 [Turdus rufiventris]